MNRRDVYNKYDGHCAYCGKRIEFDDMTLSSLDFGADWFLLCQNHYSQVGSSSPHKLKFAGAPMGKPSSKGGANTLENTIPSCQLCNNQKAERSIESRFYAFAQSAPAALQLESTSRVLSSCSFIENITETLDVKKCLELAFRAASHAGSRIGCCIEQKAISFGLEFSRSLFSVRRSYVRRSLSKCHPRHFFMVQESSTNEAC